MHHASCWKCSRSGSSWVTVCTYMSYIYDIAIHTYTTMQQLRLPTNQNTVNDKYRCQWCLWRDFNLVKTAHSLKSHCSRILNCTVQYCWVRVNLFHNLYWFERSKVQQNRNCSIKIHTGTFLETFPACIIFYIKRCWVPLCPRDNE